MEKKEVAVNLFGHEGDDMGDNMSLKKRLNPEMEIINKFPIYNEMNCILLV